MKPVAWMSLDGKFSTTEGKLFYIPLYTAPPTIQTRVKYGNPDTLETGWITIETPAPRELSDVEIHYEVDKWERQNNYKHDADVHKTLIDFARAILKKASEK
jgi:hypothetical protein